MKLLLMLSSIQLLFNFYADFDVLSGNLFDMNYDYVSLVYWAQLVPFRWISSLRLLLYGFSFALFVAFAVPCVPPHFLPGHFLNPRPNRIAIHFSTLKRFQCRGVIAPNQIKIDTKFDMIFGDGCRFVVFIFVSLSLTRRWMRIQCVHAAAKAPIILFRKV